MDDSGLTYSLEAMLGILLIAGVVVFVTASPPPMAEPSGKYSKIQLVNLGEDILSLIASTPYEDTDVNKTALYNNVSRNYTLVANKIHAAKNENVSFKVYYLGNSSLVNETLTYYASPGIPGVPNTASSGTFNLSFPEEKEYQVQVKNGGKLSNNITIYVGKYLLLLNAYGIRSGDTIRGIVTKDGMGIENLSIDIYNSSYTLRDNTNKSQEGGRFLLKWAWGPPGKFYINLSKGIPDQTGYQYRRGITIEAGSASVPNGYSISVTFDHASLVGSGKSQADGDDVRVFYWSGSGLVELDRSLDGGSSWNNASTKIWFKTQAVISASASDNNYYLYYGNSSAANPPANKSEIYLFFDDFEAGNLNKWTIVSGPWQVASDQARTGTYSLKHPAEINVDRRIWANPALNEANVSFEAWWRFSDVASVDLTQIVRRPAGADSGYWADLEGTTGWNIAEEFIGGWKEIATNNGTPTANTWTRIASVIYGTNMRVFQDGTQIVPASGSTDVGTNWTSGNIGFEKWTIGAGFAWWIDDVVVRRYVDPEPTTSLGAEESLGEDTSNLQELNVTDSTVVLSIDKNRVFETRNVTLNLINGPSGNQCSNFSSNDNYLNSSRIQCADVGGGQYNLTFNKAGSYIIQYKNVSESSNPVLVTVRTVESYLASPLSYFLGTGDLAFGDLKKLVGPFIPENMDYNLYLYRVSGDSLVEEENLFPGKIPSRDAVVVSRLVRSEAIDGAGILRELRIVLWYR